MARRSFVTLMQFVCVIVVICFYQSATNAGCQECLPSYKEVELMVHKGTAVNFKRNVEASGTIYNKLNLKQLRILKNTIFARHNYRFKDTDLTTYFKKNYPEYKPLNTHVVLSEIDKVNLTYINKIIKMNNEYKKWKGKDRERPLSTIIKLPSGPVYYYYLPDLGKLWTVPSIITFLR